MLCATNMFQLEQYSISLCIYVYIYIYWHGIKVYSTYKIIWQHEISACNKNVSTLFVCVS